jgi:hypothetical protein
VAALYLENLSSDAQSVIRSPETKLLTVRFEHDVNEAQARDAWREGFANNCQAPCHLDQQKVHTFLASVPAMRSGDVFELRFTAAGVDVTAGTKPIGEITERGLAEAVLSVFLGPNPGSQELKDGLLRGSKLASVN